MPIELIECVYSTLKKNPASIQSSCFTLVLYNFDLFFCSENTETF